MKRAVTIVVLVLVLFFTFVVSAFATNQSYTFSNNVPNTGWLKSSDKTLPKNVKFTTDLNSCTASNQTQANKGVLMKPVLSDGTAYAYKTVLPGANKLLLVGSTASARTLHIELQAVGTVYVTAKGWWYF